MKDPKRNSYNDSFTREWIDWFSKEWEEAGNRIRHAPGRSKKVGKRYVLKNLQTGVVLTDLPSIKVSSMAGFNRKRLLDLQPGEYLINRTFKVSVIKKGA